jgi:hypothetical protein
MGGVYQMGKVKKCKSCETLKAEYNELELRYVKECKYHELLSIENVATERLYSGKIKDYSILERDIRKAVMPVLELIDVNNPEGDIREEFIPLLELMKLVGDGRREELEAEIRELEAT